MSLRLVANRWRLRLVSLERRVVAWLVFGLLALLRLLPVEWALGFTDRASRRLGPWSPRHRLVLDNLRHAFPDKPAAEIAAIAGDMWGNMGRLLAEYVFMDTLFAHADEGPRHERLELVGGDIFERLRETGGAHIFFTAHLGNFELLPVAAAGYGLQIASLFRPPNNPFIASRLLDARSAKMGGLVASRAGAALALARILDEGGNIGVLVDQRFIDGVTTEFFGRPCQTSPLLAKLARRADCPIHPARCIRLPGSRFRLEIMEAIEPPRDARGDIDVPALTQAITTVVEGWVREHPGQWMWFHRRWARR